MYIRICMCMYVYMYESFIKKLFSSVKKKSLLSELILESELQTENWNRKPKKLRRESSLMALTLENLPRSPPTLSWLLCEFKYNSVNSISRTHSNSGGCTSGRGKLSNQFDLFIYGNKNLPNHGQQSFILCPVIAKSYTQSFTFISNYYDIH